MNNIFENAKFIKAEKHNSEFSLYDPLPLFRREFEISEKVENAIISVISPGFASFTINGKPITEDLFISAISNYGKLMWCHEYDVTELLYCGKNAIGVIAGNGFFNESFKTEWDYQNYPWRDSPQFLLSLKVNGKVVVESDENWVASREKSPIIYSHLRSGEYYDARKKGDDWQYVGYNDGDWHKVICSDINSGIEIKKICCQPIREAECIKPVSIVKNASGYIVDFGKNMSGYIEITVQEKRGTEILFWYSEEKTENNEPKYNYLFYGSPETDEDIKYRNEYKIVKGQRFYPKSPFHLNKLIASGETDVFKPKFCYHGFRYVTIEGLTKPPEINSIKAYFVHQNVERTADFKSGNEVLNYIYNAGIRSVYSNLFWSLTDCPTREKLGWTNDAAATCEQILINFDIKPLFEKWFTDLKKEMCDDGSLPAVIPSTGWGDNWGPVCDNLLFELPYRTYLYTGDAKILTDAIPYFNRYVDFLWNKKQENHEFILGDWTGSGNSELTPKEFVRDFYLIKALRITVFALKLNCSDCKNFQEKLIKTEKEFIETYIDSNGYSKPTSQTALSMLLAFGLYKDKSKIVKQLLETVEKDKFKLTSGMVGIQYLYDALSECGHPEYAYEIITKSEPGYKTWYESGATTLWECLDGKEKGSHNHHMFSNVIAWFFKSILGINLKFEKPAFAEIELKPCFIAEMKFAKGYIDTPKGRIEAEWRYENNEFMYKVTLPNEVVAIYNGNVLKAGINIFKVGK